MNKEKRKQYQRQYNKQYYQRNREKEIRRIREYQKRHPEKKKEWDRRYRLKIKKDPEKLKKLREYYREYMKKWRKQSPERVKEINRRVRAKRRERDKILNQIWRKNNPEKIKMIRKREYLKRKRDLKKRLEDRMRILIWHSLRSKKAGKSWEALVGYTIEDLMKHLESHFNDKMNWDNYGSYWEIDHIKPRILFHYTSPEDPAFKECWSLKNLRPLEKTENRRRGAFLGWQLKRFQAMYGIEQTGNVGLQTLQKLNEVFG
jgi:hypothetical protein